MRNVIVFTLIIICTVSCNKKDTTNAPLRLMSITISPSSDTLYIGEMLQFTCMSTYSDNTTQNVDSSVTWGTSPGASGSISANGLFTAHDSIAGMETITAAYQGQTDQAAVTVSTNITDIDGNTYRTVKIGNQWWMAENLKVTHYRNGDAIPNVTDATEWSNLTTGAYCNYDNDEGHVDTYGRLYDWYSVNDSRNIAPEGWHVPTDEEWKELEMYLGMSQSEADDIGKRGIDEGGKLKEAVTDHWMSPNAGATNESGFSALPGGFRHYYGYFVVMGYNAIFWSSTEYGGNLVWCRSLRSYFSGVNRDHYPKLFGFSVRLVRDY